jgi:hypothetical protein
VRRRRSIYEPNTDVSDKFIRPRNPDVTARLDALEQTVSALKAVCETHSKRNAALQAQLDHLAAKLRLF